MDQNRNKKLEQGENTDTPNQSSNMEPAEGSRESVNDSGDSQGGGITNRPLDREQREQDSVPERGYRKSETGSSNPDNAERT